jgi:hypothetical protein
MGSERSSEIAENDAYVSRLVEERLESNGEGLLQAEHCLLSLCLTEDAFPTCVRVWHGKHSGQSSPQEMLLSEALMSDLLLESGCPLL